MEILNAIPEIVTAILASIGGLKVVARYTPWKWDDTVLEKVEKPVKWAAEQAKRFWPSKDEER